MAILRLDLSWNPRHKEAPSEERQGDICVAHRWNVCRSSWKPRIGNLFGGYLTSINILLAPVAVNLNQPAIFGLLHESCHPRSNGYFLVALVVGYSIEIPEVEQRSFVLVDDDDDYRRDLYQSTDTNDIR